MGPYVECKAIRKSKQIDTLQGCYYWPALPQLQVAMNIGMTCWGQLTEKLWNLKHT